MSFEYCTGAWTPAGISDEGSHYKKNSGTHAGGHIWPAQPALSAVAATAAQWSYFFSPWSIFEWSIGSSPKVSFSMTMSRTGLSKVILIAHSPSISSSILPS